MGNLKERQTLLLKSPVMRSPFRNTMYFSFLSLSLFVHAMVREQVWLISRIYDKVGYAAVAQSLYHRNDTVRVRVASNGNPTQKAYFYQQINESDKRSNDNDRSYDSVRIKSKEEKEEKSLSVRTRSP